MSFKPYPKYKESGVEWLGRVPEHWTIQRLKEIAVISGGGTPNREVKEYWNGDIPWVSPKDMKTEEINSAEESITELGLSQSTSTLHPPGRVLMVIRSGILQRVVPVAITKAPVAINQDLKAIAFDGSRCLPSFFFRWVQGWNDVLLLVWAQQGATVESINQSLMRNSVVPLPPINEQFTITAFLDHETAKIDALIAEQQRLIELLQEKRQAVISHAVTKGLNPDAPMKDSGIEWLGQVPEHWKVASLRYFATFCTGATPDRANPSFWNGGIPWVKTGEIDYSLINTTEEEISQAGLDSSSCSIAPEGTLLMALYGQGATRGRVAILGIAAAFNQACVAITTDHRLSTTFLKAFFIFAYSFLRGVGNETTQMNMNVDYVRRVRVTIPPLDEQYAIAVHVATESQRFEDLVAEADRTISLLQERRSALISAAVTGQIDVRGFADEGAAA